MATSTIKTVTHEAYDTQLSNVYLYKAGNLVTLIATRGLIQSLTIPSGYRPHYNIFVPCCYLKDRQYIQGNCILASFGVIDVYDLTGKSVADANVELAVSYPV